MSLQSLSLLTREADLINTMFKNERKRENWRATARKRDREPVWSSLTSRGRSSRRYLWSSDSTLSYWFKKVTEVGGVRQEAEVVWKRLPVWCSLPVWRKREGFSSWEGVLHLAHMVPRTGHTAAHEPSLGSLRGRRATFLNAQGLVKNIITESRHESLGYAEHRFSPLSVQTGNIYTTERNIVTFNLLSGYWTWTCGSWWMDELHLTYVIHLFIVFIWYGCHYQKTVFVYWKKPASQLTNIFLCDVLLWFVSKWKLFRQWKFRFLGASHWLSEICLFLAIIVS